MFKNRENCYLRAFEPDDYKTTHKWRTDPDMLKLLVGNIFYVSSEREKKWVEEKIFDDTKEIYWAICDNKTNEMVGFTSIRQIDYRNRNVEWGGMTIGKEFWSKGYAMAANALVLKFVFEELGFNRIYTSYLDEHEVSTAIFEKMGFTIEGVSREEVYKGGKFHNVVKVSLLKSEYDAKLK
ncbi:MAG: GNAT family N-acetyltransferase [Bacteroidales bacterium]|nr:GNAT family N-acetyltransferase [Bacteroidales bacterium]MBN2757715.1 GNAT family N-acetyltransferase [Bacteroidales bacterium]